MGDKRGGDVSDDEQRVGNSKAAHQWEERPAREDECADVSNQHRRRRVPRRQLRSNVLFHRSVRQERQIPRPPGS